MRAGRADGRAGGGAAARAKDRERRAAARRGGGVRKLSPEGPSGGGPVELADRLHSAAIHLLRTVRREDGASGLTAPRLSVLSVLVFGGAHTLTQLAEAEQVRPPTMTRLVQALEADGLVRRERDGSDARVVRIHPTAKGRRLLLEGRTRRVAALAALLDGLPSADRRKLGMAAGILERLVGRASSHPPRLTRSK